MKTCWEEGVSAYYRQEGIVLEGCGVTFPFLKVDLVWGGLGGSSSYVGRSRCYGYYKLKALETPVGFIY